MSTAAERTVVKLGEIQSILDSQWVNNKLWYLIKWKAFQHCTWEPQHCIPKLAVDKYNVAQMKNDTEQLYRHHYYPVKLKDARVGQQQQTGYFNFKVIPVNNNDTSPTDNQHHQQQHQVVSIYQE